MDEAPGEVTLLLAQMKRGDKQAMARLIPLVYEELHRLAVHYMRDERPGHTLQPTALVHEEYLRLVGQKRADWQNRAQFMGVAAQLMRRILVDYARQRVTAKRGGGAVKVDGDSLEMGVTAAQSEELLAVDEAVRRLAGLDARQSKVVEMRYFGGLTVTMRGLRVSSWRKPRRPSRIYIEERASRQGG